MKSLPEHGCHHRLLPSINLRQKWKVELRKAVAADAIQICKRHAPGGGNCRRSARHGDVFQMRRPPKRGVLHNQKFAAPELPVRAVAQSIERDADHRLRDAMLREAGGDVRMMMLRAEQRDAFGLMPRLRVFRRKIFGMQITREKRRRGVERRFKGRDGFLKRLPRLNVFQIAKRRGQIRLPVFHEADGTFRMRAAGQDGLRGRKRQRYRLRQTRQAHRQLRCCPDIAGGRRLAGCSSRRTRRTQN